MRLETGSSSEAELAIRRQAWAPGRYDVPLLTAAATTTGVSRTTVASRLSTAVTAAASRKTPVKIGDRATAARVAHPRGRGSEQAGPGADVGDHQDRDQEEHDRSEVAQRVLDVGPGEDAGREGRRAAQQSDAGLDPAGRVRVRRDQECEQCGHGDQIEGRHGATLGHLGNCSRE